MERCVPTSAWHGLRDSVRTAVRRAAPVNSLEALEAIEDLVGGLRVGDVACALRSLAADALGLEEVAARSYAHGNGFTKVVLDRTHLHTLRLHVWAPGSPAEENQHDHRWSLTSRVLVGQLRTDTWRDAHLLRADFGERHELGEYRYEPDGRPGTYSLRPVEPSWLVRTGSYRLAAGTTYSLHPEVVHRIVRPAGAAFTATLVVTGANRADFTRLLSTRPRTAANGASATLTSPALRETLLTCARELERAAPSNLSEPPSSGRLTEATPSPGAIAP